jgi:hypothetical protein
MARHSRGANAEILASVIPKPDLQKPRIGGNALLRQKASLRINLIARRRN